MSTLTVRLSLVCKSVGYTRKPPAKVRQDSEPYACFGVANVACAAPLAVIPAMETNCDKLSDRKRNVTYLCVSEESAVPASGALKFEAASFVWIEPFTILELDTTSAASVGFGHVPVKMPEAAPESDTAPVVGFKTSGATALTAIVPVASGSVKNRAAEKLPPCKPICPRFDPVLFLIWIPSLKMAVPLKVTSCTPLGVMVDVAVGTPGAVSVIPPNVGEAVEFKCCESDTLDCAGVRWLRPKSTTSNERTVSG